MISVEDAKQVKILLVDDDENYVNVTKMYLEEQGLNISATTKPQEALKICQKETVDIVLLDYFMPDITGEEFVKELRKFNNKILVILQTGFSDKKPPIETLASLDIQGYYDKAKGVEELLLITLSAIKTMKLIKLNRLQEIKLSSLNYKKQLLGELSLGLINEAKGQLFSISAANKSIRMGTEDFKDENNIIDDANQKVGKAFSALGFESVKILRISDVIEIVRTLLASKIKECIADLVLNAEDESLIVRKNADTLIFLLIETIKSLLDQGQKKIRVVFKESEQLTISFENELEYDKEFAKKIVLFLTDKEGIKYSLKDKKANIFLDN